MFCREASIRASQEYGEIIAPIKCRSWTCDECAPERQHQLQSQCINGKPNRFITITCRYGEFRRKECAAKAIALAWRTFVQKWRKEKPWHKGQYIAVMEETKKGWPHLHILWRGHWISQQSLSQHMSEWLNSPNVDIRQITNVKQRAYYVAQYFSKAPVRFGTCKRYWSSQKYAKPYNTDAPRAFPEGVSVSMVPENVFNLLHEWYREGKDVWTTRNHLYGWGWLHDPETGEVYERPTDTTPHQWGVAFDDI